MATFKPTSNKKNGGSTFKATGRQSYSADVISDWERENKQALQVLNSLGGRINNNEWLSSDDRNAYKSALDSYIKTGNDLRNVSKKLGASYTAKQDKEWEEYISSLGSGYTGMNDFYSQFADEREYGAWSADNKKRQEYNSTMSLGDFSQYSEAGKGAANPSWNDAHAPLDILGWKPFGDGQEIGNMVTFAESNYQNAVNAHAQSMYNGTSNPLATSVTNIALYMTDEEKSIYNYYIGKGEKAKADEYLEYLTDTFNQRAAEKIAQQSNGNINELLISGISGIQTGVQGFENFVNGVLGKEGVNNSALQYADATMRADNTGLWQIANDLTSSLGNMAPSLVVGTFTGGLGGAITMGVSSAGNAYADMMEKGYSVNQARAYGLLTGASEGALSYALGGISKLGGKISGNVVSKIVGGIDNAIAKAAIQFGGNLISEATEEGLQTFLEPIFESFVTGEELEMASVEEIVYSGLLGALSAGLLEGPSTAINTAANIYNTNKIYSADVRALTAEALELNPNSKTAQRADSRLDAGKKVSASDIYSMVQNNEAAINKSDVSKIQSAVEQRLSELGEKGDLTKLSEALAKQAAGEELSLPEKRAINKSLYGVQVSEELNADNIRSGEYSYTTAWAEEIGTDRVNTEEYNRLTDAPSSTAIGPPSPTGGRFTSEQARDGATSTFKPTKNATKTESETETENSTLTEASQKYGKHAKAMERTYVEGQDVEKYDAAYSIAYEIGKNGGKLDYAMQSEAAAYLTESQRRIAYETGAAASKAKKSPNDLKTSAKGGTINTESETFANESGEGIHLRDSGQRNGSSDTQREISRMEGGAGEAKGPSSVSKADSFPRGGSLGTGEQTNGRASKKAADGEATALLNEGREVSARTLGVNGGTDTRKVRLLEGDKLTASMKAAQQVAKENGLTVKFFVGDNLSIIEDGEEMSVRGYIRGDTVLIRADHPLYTAEQLMRHEAGHYLIAQGKINLDEVRTRLKEIVGDENLESVAQMYVDAYAETGMSAEAVWEECVCDSLGDMNIFASQADVAEFVGQRQLEIKEIAESQVKEANETRGPPEGKTSRETVDSDVATAEKYFGTTYKINEAGYLTTNGKLLDFSGKHDGAPGGYRTVDHRDIREALGWDYGGEDYSGGMIKFMQAGNIRLIPETGGINLSVKPNKAQLEVLDRYISNFRGEVILDIDDVNGKTIVSIEYPKHTYSKRIINDINGYFDNGTMPEQPSYLGQFRYSRETVDGQAITNYDVEPINAESSNNATSRGDIVLESTQDVKNAIESSLNDGHLQENYILGAINNSVKSKIEQDVKTDIFKTGEYVFKISSDSIRHISKHFGTVDDITDAIYRLYDVVCNYDNVDLIPYSPYNQVRLKFEKKYYDYSFLSVEFASKKTRSLNLVTFYATKNNKKIENKIQSPVDNEKSTARGVSFSNNSIPQENDSVNREFSDNGAKTSRELEIEYDNMRKWAITATDSESLGGKVPLESLDRDIVHYEPISNKAVLAGANDHLERMGYDKAVAYFRGCLEKQSVTLQDLVMGERLIQEAVKRGDNATAAELIQSVAILGTELGQKVQALSIIKRLTPEGQLGMLKRVVERGKARGDKIFDGVEITPEMEKLILAAYRKDGSFDQKKLNRAVEKVKQKLADKMKVTKLEKLNAWRYLSMLGNPKTHIRNLVSNVAMKGTMAVKDAVAKTLEDSTDAILKGLGKEGIKRTKTWRQKSEAVKKFAKQTAEDMQREISGGGKYNESASIKEKRQIFKNKILNKLYNLNSELLSKEDWWFSRSAFENAFGEFLNANGISTKADIENNPKLVEKARQYAIEQAQIATFQQYSWLANKISEIEKKNAVTSVTVGAVLPFKKTPINIAKAGLNYSPLGFAKTLTYDIYQVKKDKMEASQLIDHLAQNITGTALALVGYLLASTGFLAGAGDDDKEGEYDYQLGEQDYSVKIGNKSYSLSWLSPVAMPLFVGANLYEQLIEKKEWNPDVVIQTLAQTLDPLSEMSFLSGLDSVLSSYDSGVMKFAGIAESAAQSYITQFIPTLLSQTATAFDDTKRSTKVGGDSGFEFFDSTINKLVLKIPFLRRTLEPSLDIWGNEISTSDNIISGAFEAFIAPYAVKKDISSGIDKELKALYSESGETAIIPYIPKNSITYKGEQYKMSDKEYTSFKKTFGQTSYELLKNLFASSKYKNETMENKVKMVKKVYEQAREETKKAFFEGRNINFAD